MKRMTMTALGFSMLALPALAMGEGVVELDANEDGVLSLEEVQAVYPDVTVETFVAMDTDQDGLLAEEEVAAAQDGGMWPAAPEAESES